MARRLIVVWALLGVTLLLGRPILRMAPIALEVLRQPLDFWRVGAMIISVLFMAVGEGYYAFHLRFAPRFADRLVRLVEQPKPLQALLAPLTCMGLVPFDREDFALWGRSLLVVVAIVALVLSVRSLEQPWRGIILLGVVLALTVGLMSTLWRSVQGLRRARRETT
jgi:hypothetical protein